MTTTTTTTTTIMEDVALETIERLKARLERIEYVLQGDVPSRKAVRRPSLDLDPFGRSVPKRLSQLDRDLNRLRRQWPVIDDLLQLRRS